MQLSANTNTAFARLHQFVRGLLISRPVADTGICIHVPGIGLIGDYATPEDAEAALHYLPFSARQKATICDADGCCLSR